jgi:regulatory protein
VAVELDGERWRTLPAEAVVAAGLVVGAPLGRSQAAALARERRRLAALAIAGRALARRDLSRHELEQRLERRGIAPASTERTLDALARVGAQSDERAARLRAETMAARDWGDEAILADLEQRGIGRGEAEVAIAGIEPEHERAARIVRRFGRTAKAAQTLARRGFPEEIVVSVVADMSQGE